MIVRRQQKNVQVTGQRFGRYVVIREVEPELRPNGRGSIRRVLARCECGAERTVHLQNLTSKKSVSCGCFSRDASRKRATIHGDAGSQEHNCWLGIIRRCENPKVQNYARYGGRGISICSRWRHGEGGVSGFACFLADMGRKPSPAHSIDRIDNDGDYTPKNCRWATSSEQRRNQRQR